MASIGTLSIKLVVVAKDLRRGLAEAQKDIANTAAAVKQSGFVANITEAFQEINSSARKFGSGILEAIISHREIDRVRQRLGEIVQKFRAAQVNATINPTPTNNRRAGAFRAMIPQNWNYLDRLEERFAQAASAINSGFIGVIKGGFMSIGSATIAIIPLIESITAAFMKLSLVVGTVATTIVVGLVGGALKALHAAAEDLRQGNMMGFTSQEYQALGLAARQTGVDHRSLITAIRRFSSDAIEAANDAERLDGKLGVMRKHLQSFGISMGMLQGKSEAGVFQVVLDQLAKFETAGQRMEAARHLVGRFGVDVLRIAQMSKAELQKLNEEVKRMGLALSTMDQSKLLRAEVAFQNMKASLQGLFTQIAVKLSPYITAIANEISKWAQNGRVVESIVNGIVSAFKSMATNVYAVASAAVVLLEIYGHIAIIVGLASKNLLLVAKGVAAIVAVGILDGQLRRLKPTIDGLKDGIDRVMAAGAKGQNFWDRIKDAAVAMIRAKEEINRAAQARIANLLEFSTNLSRSLENPIEKFLRLQDTMNKASKTNIFGAPILDKLTHAKGMLKELETLEKALGIDKVKAAPLALKGSQEAQHIFTDLINNPRLSVEERIERATKASEGLLEIIKENTRQMANAMLVRGNIIMAPGPLQ